METESLIANISHDDLYQVANAIWSTHIYMHLGILVLE